MACGVKAAFFQRLADDLKQYLGDQQADQEYKHRIKHGGAVFFQPVDEFVVHIFTSSENYAHFCEGFFNGVGVKIKVIAFVGTLFIFDPGKEHIVLGKVGV